MNKKHLILSSILAAASLTAVAAPVSRERAVDVASAYLKARGGAPASTASVSVVKDAYYIVNFSPRGWAIVSADDNAEPVIGYSTTGSLSTHNMPDNMRGMLGQYAAEVKFAAANAKKRHNAWSSVSNYAISRAGADDNGRIDPIIAVHWNQPAPFNYYCPGSGANKALVGCVAVAMSQAMSVQRYPSRPTGTVNYTPAGYSNIQLNFDGERDYNWDEMLQGANNYREAARLLYHAGVSVHMHYGADGSGVYTNELYRISDALRENFRYGNDVTYYLRTSYEAQNGKQAWTRLILNELTAGRAVVYNGTGDGGGHSFNIDGYDGAGKFHVNWGWAGSGDGFFLLSNLTDAYQGISFPNNHSAIVGIGSPDRELRSIELTETSIDENLPAGSVVSEVLVNGTTPKPGYSFIVRGMLKGSTYQKVPFTIVNNQLVTTEVLSAATAASYDIDIVVSENVGNTSLPATFTIKVEPWRSIEAATSLTYNRATGDFELRTKHNVSYVIRSAAGATLASGNIAPLPRMTFNRSILADGRNTLELRCGNESKTLTIVK